MAKKNTKACIISPNRFRMRKLVDDTFYDILHSGKGVSLVIFTSQGCASCRAWKAVLMDYLNINPSLIIYEVDAHESMALANEYEIFHLPALFLFSDGEFHSELNCEANTEQIHQAIRRALQAPAQEAP
ncbi:MAG: thioredoxin family protein [Gammaproteobacteria bacterium]|nr:thioredoxin family protein [Gammaproteobacteria bacterium]